MHRFILAAFVAIGMLVPATAGAQSTLIVPRNPADFLYVDRETVVFLRDYVAEHGKGPPPDVGGNTHHELEWEVFETPCAEMAIWVLMPIDEMFPDIGFDGKLCTLPYKLKDRTINVEGPFFGRIDLSGKANRWFISTPQVTDGKDVVTPDAAAIQALLEKVLKDIVAQTKAPPKNAWGTLFGQPR